ncbi:MAG: hypothetical protein V1774_01660 [Candidatus Eisenbacteria bacterium]
MSAARSVLLFAASMLFASLTLLPASASVPRIVLAEDFTASW